MVVTDSFGLAQEAFGYFNVHMDVKNVVPWPNVGKFEMVDVEQAEGGIGILELVKYVWKGRRQRWTMIVIF